MTEMKHAGRLALRQEGDWWVAYYATPVSMMNAIEMGRIRMALVVDNRERKAMFMEIMKHALDELLKKATGSEVMSWDERTAPENERAGHG